VRLRCLPDQEFFTPPFTPTFRVRPAHGLDTPPPPPGPFNFTSFQAELLPQWLARFAVAGGSTVGAYSFLQGTGIPSLYGSADVVHVLTVVGELAGLSPSQRAQWAAHLNTFLNASGFFALQAVEGQTGYQPWHASGYGYSAFKLLAQFPAYPPVWSQAIAAADETVWNATMWAILTDPAGVWSRSHKLAAIPTTLLNADPGTNTTQYEAFFNWLWPFLNATSSPTIGYWCEPPNPLPPSCMCLGGAFHVAFTHGCVHRPLPNPWALLNTTLALQDPSTGLWNGDAAPGYMDLDGLYTAARASVQLGRARWDDVRIMCQRYLAAAQRALSDAAVVLSPTGAYGSSSHTLAAAVSGVAECGRWFPDLVVTASGGSPWVNSVDVGCFV